ncbi:hypothetical protein JOF29_003469 [Kribbella aluminosa]|uniref:Uncharacterized protein n=1 Tax=Kribbella aluminosa TaxID=416017 RepID=A0ABS4UL53_9ACTN|nr:hypothetical protein [Kribbella aluminosa]MBP2352386.1 hypothetical protein [Kribbella aluminosa]
MQPTASDAPVIAASPCGAAAATTSAQRLPALMCAVCVSASTVTPVIRVVVTTIPPCIGFGMPWPVARTRICVPVPAAARTTATASSSDVRPTTTSGVCVTARLKPDSSSAYPSSAGVSTGPATSLRSRVINSSVMWFPLLRGSVPHTRVTF